MSAIRKRDTKPELAVRRFLHSKGLRYRLYKSSLPGCPDIVFPSHRVVVLVPRLLIPGYSLAARTIFSSAGERLLRSRPVLSATKARPSSAERARIAWRISSPSACRFSAFELCEVHERLNAADCPRDAFIHGTSILWRTALVWRNPTLVQLTKRSREIALI